jgi:hypothetical protein
VDDAAVSARVVVEATDPADDSSLGESAREQATVPAARIAERHPKRSDTIEAVVGRDEGGIDRMTTRLIERNYGVQGPGRLSICTPSSSM